MEEATPRWANTCVHRVHLINNYSETPVFEKKKKKEIERG